MKTGIVYDSIYLEHNEKGHPENKDRLISIVQEIENRGLFKHLQKIKPRRATVEEVSLNHDINYIQEIHDFCASGGGYLDPDTYANSMSYETALYGVGGVLEGIDRLLSGEVSAVFCAIRPPGHHAERSRAMGSPPF
jgi:Deacetylases, including yeast histone deacetylase and acetoin utilization protein